MDTSPAGDKKKLLDQLWREQPRKTGTLLNFAGRALPAAPRPGGCTAEDLAREMRDRLGWPEWVLVYPKPPQPVVALSRLARARTGRGGVLWVAPGTGSPLEPPRDEPGVMVLRSDWAPHPDTVRSAALEAAERKMLLVVDESVTGFRLARGGAVESLGLNADAALYPLELPGKRTLALLAGRGEKPQTPVRTPEDRDLAAAAGVLDWLDAVDLPARLEELATDLVTGLEYFRVRAGLSDEVRLEPGFSRLPRLGGRRVWAFLELCREEGLYLNPLVIPDPDMEPAEARIPLWTALLRAFSQLRVLPEGDKAPLGWKDAYPTSCGRVEEMLATLDN